MRFLLIFLLLLPLQADKIKDITNIVGIRDNQLIGYGLVVGLNGTGDGSSKATTQSMASLLEGLNVKIDANAIKSKNIASVVVTANLPAFARSGDRLDITLSSIGSASSLEGGQLLMTPLKAIDGNIYAVAQGAVSVGGKSGKGDAVAYHTTAANVINGATVEKEMPTKLHDLKSTTLSLKQTNINNAIAVQNSINRAFGLHSALAVDARTIKLTKPEHVTMVEFLAKLQNIEVEFHREEKIIIDEKTGTIVAGIDVTVDPVVVTHGELTIKISPRHQLPLADENNVDLSEGMMLDRQNSILATDTKAPTIASVTRALQKLGQTPKDIVAILLAMRKMGAIRVKVEVV
jgi:flagellar P-ring protein precursor FlgI